MALSFDQIESKIQQAIYQSFVRPISDAYVVSVFPDEAIVKVYDNKETYYQVGYTVSGDEIILAEQSTWQAVERAWVAKAIAMSNTLKTVSKTDDWLRVANHIILFGERDLSGVLSYDPAKKSFDINPKGRGEFFTKATAVESAYTATGVLHMDIEHGLSRLLDGPDAPGEDDIIGFVDWKTAKTTEKGVWVEQALNRRNQYVQTLETLVEMGLMGTSTEAVPELVQIDKKGEIKTWPLKRNTLSFMPADPRMMGENAVIALKSLVDRFPGLKAVLPQDGGDPSATGKAPNLPATSPNPAIPKKENTMGENTQTPDAGHHDARMEAVESKLETMSKGVTTILEALEKMPALNSAGYFTNDGGTADPKIKSFGDFLLAVYRKDDKRLKGVYAAIKDIGGSGVAGEVLVPPEYTADLLKLADMQSQITSRVQTIPVSRDSGNWPALDQYVAPTAGAGNTAEAGGVKATVTKAGATLTETQPSFTEIAWRVHKVGGFTEVENEIIADSPLAIEALLSSLFAIAIAAKNERNILRGSGVGEPLGILNAPAAVAVTPATNNVFAYADALTMLSKFKAAGGTPVWIIHQSIWPDIGKFEVGTGGAVYMSNVQVGLGSPLLGAPILQSEHLAQADSSGCVLLADLRAYLLFQRGVLTIAFSEHAAFKEQKGTWTFHQRNDGQPWLKNKITLADPQGSFQVSPFVYFND